jgi:gamma-glutamyl-gamma-aminobutyraldehyde dehydrogenase|tara:strand:+ start:4892 stop:6361 length:1470 start_codon:yes stop_codon:yes gene_type:complete
VHQEQIDSLREIAIISPQMIIGGRGVAAISGAVLDVVSPINGQVIAQLPNAGVCDVDAAVKAARTAFESGAWSKATPAARKTVLLKWAGLIESNALELAVLGVRDNGTEISMAFKAEPMSAAGTVRYYAEAIDKVYGEIAPTGLDTLALIHREPVGVVGAIVPWNFPMMIAAWKIAPALATGNSVVLKPSEMASLSVLRMIALAHEAGLPDGVLNVVTGGAVTGQAIARSMDVDALVFTGSVNVGRSLMQDAAQTNLKRVFLELGGKSPHIVFDDTTDLDAAAASVVGGIFRNAGQVCVAGSRLLVQRDIHDIFVDKIIELTSKMRVGDPLQLDTQIGALNSKVHLDRVLAMLDGVSSIAYGGKQILADTGGFYMQPTVVTQMDLGDKLVREEVFGPILTVTPFMDEADAIRQANSSELGLSAGVWTSNLGLAHRMIAAIRAGVVHVNTYGGVDNTVPLGGFKQSGNGHDKSLHALDKFINKKTAWIKL